MVTGSWSPSKPHVASARGVLASPPRASHVSPAQEDRRGASHPGPDGILSWAVAVICFVINLLSSVFNRCAGLFFNSMMSTFEASRGEVAVPVSLYGGFYNLAGLLAGALIQAFGVRRTMVLGGVMMSIGFCVSLFANSPTFLVFTVGLATGAGQGIVLSSSVVAVTRYFDKRRGIALGLNLAGPPVTSLLVPKFLQWMLDEYGLRGTFFVLGACFANVAALGTLLHKPPWEKDKSTSSTGAAFKVAQSFLQRPSVVCGGQDNSGICTQIEPSSAQENRKPTQISSGNSSPARRSTRASVNRPPDLISEGTVATIVSASSRRHSRHASSGLSRDETDAPPTAVASLERSAARERRGTIMSIAGSMFAVQMNALSDVNTSLRRSRLMSASASCNLPPELSELPAVKAQGRPPSLSIGNLKDVLKEPRIYLHSLSFFAYAFFVDTYLAVILDFAKDIGVPPSESIHALTLFSALDAVGRFGLPFLSDYEVTSTELLLTLSYLGLAVIAEAAPLLSGKLPFVCIAALLGIPGGYIIVGTSEILCKEHGAKNLPMAFGCLTLVAAIGYFIRPPIIGVFRDTFGSYNGLFQLQGGLLLLSSVVNLGIWAMSRSSRNKSSYTHDVQDNGYASCETPQPVNEANRTAQA